MLMSDKPVLSFSFRISFLYCLFLWKSCQDTSQVLMRSRLSRSKAFAFTPFLASWEVLIPQTISRVVLSKQQVQKDPKIYIWANLLTFVVVSSVKGPKVLSLG